MHLKGSELKDNQFVFVNGKRIAADIYELDIKEGWVDILLPIITSVQEVTPFKEPKDEPNLSGYTLRRLSGKVEIKSVSTAPHYKTS